MSRVTGIPAENLVGDEPWADNDPAAFAPVLARLGAGLARHPGPAVREVVRLTGDLVLATADVAARAVGLADVPTSPTPAPGDRRFSDPAWDEHPWFLAQRQAYLAWSRHLRRLAGAGGLDDADAAKADFALGMVADALAPTNFLGTNPVALRKAVATGGSSVVEGLANFLEDVAENGARPRQVDASALRVGEELACTPGQVVFRNDIVEVIQYAPQTKSVYQTPLLLSPPWINRYYIMDLAPGRSFAEWAVSHGHTTFAMSYRNADASMRDVGLDDYLLRGLDAALAVVSEITGEEKVNVAGLCVGGMLASMLAAYQAQGGADRVRSLTLLNTLLDFRQPGDLGAFTDPEAVAGVERRMARTGFLDGREMATTFDSLRANDLIWNYVSGNWLMGDQPPAFDILAWNADSIGVPEATHAAYLRALYLENRLAEGTMTMGGRRLCLDDITADTYILAAQADHITPWKSSYATTGLLGGPVRFVLTSAGHIAGIVNPPGPKRRYWTNETLSPTPEAWQEGAVQHDGSWWGDWATWIGRRAGRRRPPRAIGSTAHPAIGDAPGTYVHA
jgi:polyhydroxyalkanoate synthase